MSILEQYTGRRGRGGRPVHPGWHEFTQRQKRIIRGYETDNVRLRELRAIIHKAEELRMPIIVDIVVDMYETIVADRTPPKYTIEEALEVLQRLTPWKRNV